MIQWLLLTARLLLAIHKREEHEKTPVIGNRINDTRSKRGQTDWQGMQDRTGQNLHSSEYYFWR